MAENSKYINPSRGALDEALEKANKLIGKAEGLKALGEETTRIFDKVFSGSEEEVKDLLDANEGLRNQLGATTARMEEVTKLVNSQVKLSEQLADNLGFNTVEGLKKAIGEYDEYERKLKEIEKQHIAIQNVENDNAMAKRDKKAILAGMRARLAEMNAEATTLQQNENIANILNNQSTYIDGLNKINGVQEDINILNKAAVVNSRELNQNYKAANGELKEQKKLAGTLKSLWDGVYEGGAVGAKQWLSIDDAIFKMGRQMGMAVSQIKGGQRQVLSEYGELATKLGMPVKDILAFQNKYTEATGKAVVLTKSEVLSIGRLSQVMGNNAPVNDMVSGMDNFGASASTAIDYLTLNMARAASEGLNVTASSAAFAKNIKMASKYTFKNGIEGVSKMTMLSQRLKFNMESIGAVIDKFSDIEGAITTSANLQVLGGSYATQFSNPMVAMGEALLDAEGFTDRIVKTFANSLVFNKERGIAEASPIEKAKMKEAAKQLGLDYNEVWNMATQQVKGQEIGKEIAGKDFTEEERSFLINKAQYDGVNNRWVINQFDENGNEVPIDIKNINKSQLKAVQLQTNVERSVQTDVHAIRNQLDKFLGEYTNQTLSAEELKTGVKERAATGMANMMDTPMGWFKDGLSAFGGAATSLLVGYKMFKGPFSSFMKNKYDKSPFEWAAKKLRGGGSAASRGAMGKGAAGRGAARAAGKGTMAKSMKGLGAKAIRNSKSLAGKLFKTGAKSVGSKVLGAAGVGLEVYNAVDAVNTYDIAKQQIMSDNSMNAEQKMAADYMARKERNKSMGGAIGGLIGGGIGFALGGPLGMAIGGLIGNGIGNLIGGSTTKKSNRAMAGASGGPNDSAAVSNNILNNIANDTRLMASYITNSDTSFANATIPSMAGVGRNSYSTIASDSAYVNEYINNSPNTTMVVQSSAVAGEQVAQQVSQAKPDGEKTYVKPVENNLANNNEGSANGKTDNLNTNVNVNISGTLQLAANGKTSQINAEELLNDVSFKRGLIDAIADAMSRTNVTGTVNKVKNIGMSVGMA